MTTPERNPSVPSRSPFSPAPPVCCSAAMRPPRPSSSRDPCRRARLARQRAVARPRLPASRSAAAPRPGRRPPPAPSPAAPGGRRRAGADCTKAMRSCARSRRSASTSSGGESGASSSTTPASASIASRACSRSGVLGARHAEPDRRLVREHHRRLGEQVARPQPQQLLREQRAHRRHPDRPGRDRRRRRDRARGRGHRP